MSTAETLLGIALAISAAFLFNYAPILQKSAIDRMDELSLTHNLGGSIRMLLRSRKWLLGTCLALLGIVPYLIAMNLVGISVLQPLMSIGLIFLVYFGIRSLRERLAFREFVGIGMMVVMPVFLHAAAVTNIQADILEPAVLRVLVVFSLLLVAATVVVLAVDRIMQNPSLAGLFWSLAAGVAFGLAALMLQGALAFLRAGGEGIVGTVACAVLAALSGSFAAFVFQIALQKGAATRAGPINHSVNTLLAITGGIVIFGQEVGNYWLYALAVIFTLVATFLLGKYEGVARATSGPRHPRTPDKRKL